MNEVKRDYSIFTKKELVEYLNKYDTNMWSLHGMFENLIERKMNKIILEMEEQNKAGEQLIDKLDGNSEEIKWSKMLEIKNNHENWDKLSKEYDKLSKFRFGK